MGFAYTGTTDSTIWAFSNIASFPTSMANTKTFAPHNVITTRYRASFPPTMVTAELIIPQSSLGTIDFFT
eukprot:CAMPEP_0204860040 /NCGR_PEP_ID=MMETSP1347-20130617/24070_1 /ASSEMBLY_ACC=CAM_ASM_000690 /TAXON_ID=215587 /ORGANISM="Aplanochytrium stocchinoi, Strain GSBS06" /LENGTH=69 /DNA_ID=CAMNT_0052008663 /DNA_START=1893 /DNA_END=2102 /DNA_ORIENTATION=+